MIRLGRIAMLFRFARVRGQARTKVFLLLGAILLLLLGMGWVGLKVVAGLNANTQEIIRLQSKIAAYRQIQHDATSGSFNVAAALLSADNSTLENALRQLYQFGYDLERLQFVARDDALLIEEIIADHHRFEEAVTQVVTMIRAGNTTDAHRFTDTQVRTLADQLEYATNAMVNRAEAAMLDGIEDSARSYTISRLVVITFVVTSALLALVLGHAISWSMVGPVIDKLLNSILPSLAVAELTSTNRVQPRRYEEVAVLFGDIVGFTQYCDRHTPEEVATNLQLFVEEFERLTVKHGLEKIKTIGDAVLATGNLLAPHHDPVMACVLLARDLASVSACSPAQWHIRVGVHIGPVVAGVIGQTKFTFDLWGDTVNVAARLVGFGGPAIHLSGDAWARVSSRCVGVALGEVKLKGKNSVTVHRFEYTSPALA